MEESIWRVLVLCRLPISRLYSVYIHDVADHSLLHHPYQAQDTVIHPGEQSANTQQQRNKRNRNVLQLSIAIVLVFVFCWLPYSTNILIRRYTAASSTHFSCGFWLYDVVTYYMGVGYCAINPIICFVFSSNYRQALKRLMNCS